MTPDEGQGRAEALLANLWQKHIDGDSAVITDRDGALALITSALRDERRRTLEEVKAALCKDRLLKQFFDVNFWDAHHVDIVWRHNGQDKRYEADWLKDLWHLTQAIREQARRGGEDTHV